MSIPSALRGLALLIFVLLPAGASASSFKVIPPTNSSADQYVESVPTAAGNRSTVPVASPGSATVPATRPAPSIAPATRAQLVARGVDGRRTAALASRYAPARVSLRTRPQRRSDRSSAGLSSAGGSRGGRTAVLPSQGGGGGGGGGGGSGGSSSSGGSGSSGHGAAPLGALARALVGSGAQGGPGAGFAIVLALSAFGVGVVALRRRSG